MGRSSVLDLVDDETCARASSEKRKSPAVLYCYKRDKTNEIIPQQPRLKLNDQLSLLFIFVCVIRQAAESGHRGVRGVNVAISHQPITR